MRNSANFLESAETPANYDDVADVERKSIEFRKLLEVSKEERDRVQRMQVIDRAAAAIAAARAILEEAQMARKLPEVDGDSTVEIGWSGDSGGSEAQGKANESSNLITTTGVGNLTPGPIFWSWTPPPETGDRDSFTKLTKQASLYTNKMIPRLEKEKTINALPLPLESKLLETNHSPPLPPLQSLVEVQKVEIVSSTPEMAKSEGKSEISVQFSAQAEEAALALNKKSETALQGVNPDGLRWWKETGVEKRPDGVLCRWTLMRGLSADKALEWEDKYWEAADQFGYKELGSEKSGRDAFGNVWREFWTETMGMENGLTYFEKTADKWGKNGKGDEWQEKWWESYDASGQAEKWTHKWCSIDPNTPLEAGHAHVWHERWGEKYDGMGSSTKYTDKWAERLEGDRWTKWGDKWDENFDTNGHGVKQGETWWQGKHGERWNRTWGEHHNGSGWVHKYGKSSCGEHWDTHELQETWYERFPHFGFTQCFDNSVQLRQVRKPSDW